MSNYKDLANKILTFIANKKKQNKKLKFAHKRLHRFNYENNLKKYFDITKEIMRLKND